MTTLKDEIRMLNRDGPDIGPLGEALVVYNPQIFDDAIAVVRETVAMCTHCGTTIRFIDQLPREHTMFCPQCRTERVFQS